jgi:hypothetical protein
VRHQVAEVPELAAEITGYQGHARACPCCGKITRAAIPEAMRLTKCSDAIWELYEPCYSRNSNRRLREYTILLRNKKSKAISTLVKGQVVLNYIILKGTS